MTTVETPPAQSKRCTKCKQVQPVENFTKKSANKDGLNRGLLKRKAIELRTIFPGGETVALIRLPGQQARSHAESWRDDVSGFESDEQAAAC